MHSSATDYPPLPEHPSPAYFSRRRQSIPSTSTAAATTADNPDTLPKIVASPSLTAWKSADGLVHSTPTATASSNSASASKNGRRSSRLLSVRQSSSKHNATLSPYQVYPTSLPANPHTSLEQHQHTPSSHHSSIPITQRIRKLSFSRAPTSPKPPPPQYTADVVMTNTINKDYDPATGNKVINNYMIIKEIGRGVHGKVKLAEDMETGELVVSLEEEHDLARCPLWIDITCVGDQNC